MVNYDVIRNATATAIKALGIQESKGLTALNGPRTKVIGDALVNKLTVYGEGKAPSDEFLAKVFLKAAPVLAQPWSSNIEMVDMLYKIATDVEAIGDFRDDTGKPGDNKDGDKDEGEGDGAPDNGQGEQDQGQGQDQGQDQNGNKGEGNSNDSPVDGRSYEGDGQHQEDNKNAAKEDKDGGTPPLMLRLYLFTQYKDNMYREKDEESLNWMMTAEFPVGGEMGFGGIATILADDLHLKSFKTELKGKFNERKKMVENMLDSTGYIERLVAFRAGLPVNPVLLLEAGAILAPANIEVSDLKEMYISQNLNDPERFYCESIMEEPYGKSMLQIHDKYMGGDSELFGVVMQVMALHGKKAACPIHYNGEEVLITTTEQFPPAGDLGPGVDIEIPEFDDGWVAPYWFKKMAILALNGFNVFLKGERGLGKSEAVIHLGRMLNLPVFSCTSPATRFDVVGFKDANGIYRRSAITAGALQKCIVFIDEFDRSQEEAVIALNPILANGIIEGDDGSSISVHPECIFIVAGNTSGHGANAMYNTAHQLDASTLDRFTVVQCGVDENILKVCATNRRGKVDTKAVEFVMDFKQACIEAGFPEHTPSYRGLRDFVLQIDLFGDALEAMRGTIIRESIPKDDLGIICGYMKKRNTYVKTLKDYQEGMSEEEY